MPFSVARLSIPLMVLGLLAGCASYTAGPVTDSLSETSQGRIWFTSKDAYDFADLVDGTAPDIVVHGDLVVPEGEWSGAAVVFSHGSGGVFAREYAYADRLAERGHAVFILDHFSPRRTLSTAHSQVRVTEQMMTADVFAALNLLATHPRIDPDRIGVTGWSKGGIVAVIASVERLAGYANPEGRRFGFGVAFYPYCGFTFPGDRLSGPLLMLLGELDDWTPSAPCVDLAEDFRSRGEPVEDVVFEGAYHAFDSSGKVRRGADWITIRDTSPRCTLFVDRDGTTRTRDLSHDIATYNDRLAFLKSCAVRGATSGGNAAARSRSWDLFVDFIDRSVAAD